MQSCLVGTVPPNRCFQEFRWRIDPLTVTGQPSPQHSLTNAITSLCAPILPEPPLPPSWKTVSSQLSPISLPIPYHSRVQCPASSYLPPQTTRQSLADRGRHAVEIWLLLIAFKMSHPQSAGRPKTAGASVVGLTGGVSRWADRCRGRRELELELTQVWRRIPWKAGTTCP